MHCCLQGMPRALWTGAISFGLVNIPVKLYRATTSSSGRSVAFHLLHDKCGTRIKNVRWCPHCDEAVDWKQVVKGYEVSKGRYVKVEKQELDEILPDEDFAAVSIDSFVDGAEVDPLYYDRAYYAAPEGSPKAYLLLTRALNESNKVAVARVILRTRSHLAALLPRGGHLLLATLFYDSEIVDARKVPDLPAQKDTAHVDKRQLATALQLVESMTVKWDPSKYRDEYAEKVDELVKEKVSGGEVTTELPSVAAGGQVVDLMAALKKSVEQTTREAAPRAARTTPRRGSRTRPRRLRASKR
jgi:DNA end-binding protein Ku